MNYARFCLRCGTWANDRDWELHHSPRCEHQATWYCLSHNKQHDKPYCNCPEPTHGELTTGLTTGRKTWFCTNCRKYCNSVDSFHSHNCVMTERSKTHSWCNKHQVWSPRIDRTQEPIKPTQGEDMFHVEINNTKAGHVGVVVYDAHPPLVVWESQPFPVAEATTDEPKSSKMKAEEAARAAIAAAAEAMFAKVK